MLSFQRNEWVFLRGSCASNEFMVGKCPDGDHVGFIVVSPQSWRFDQDVKRKSARERNDTISN